MTGELFDVGHEVLHTDRPSPNPQSTQRPSSSDPCQCPTETAQASQHWETPLVPVPPIPNIIPPEPPNPTLINHLSSRRAAMLLLLPLLLLHLTRLHRDALRHLLLSKPRHNPHHHRIPLTPAAAPPRAGATPTAPCGRGYHTKDSRRPPWRGRRRRRGGHLLPCPAGLPSRLGFVCLMAKRLSVCKLRIFLQLNGDGWASFQRTAVLKSMQQRVGTNLTVAGHLHVGPKRNDHPKLCPW